MARGWESKNVEEQQELSKMSNTGTKMQIDPQEQERVRKKRGVELAIAKINADIANSRDERHKQMLESAKTDLERQLQSLG
jgi:hypothetical protein